MEAANKGHAGIVSTLLAAGADASLLTDVSGKFDRFVCNSYTSLLAVVL